MLYERSMRIAEGGYCDDCIIHVDYSIDMANANDDEEHIIAHLLVSSVKGDLTIALDMNYADADPLVVMPYCAYDEAVEYGYKFAYKVRSIVAHAISMLNECRAGNFEVLDAASLDEFDDVLVSYNESVSVAQSAD